jgi:hypothetical protein
MGKDDNETATAKTEETRPVPGLSEEQRTELKDKLRDLARGVGGTTRLNETMAWSPATTS